MAIIDLFLKNISVPLTEINIPFTEWLLKEEEGPGWDCVKELFRNMDDGREKYCVSLYKYTRGRYIIDEDGPRYPYYRYTYGRNYLFVELTSESLALKRFLENYTRTHEGILNDNQANAVFVHPVQFSSPLTIRPNETILIIAHDGDPIYLLSHG